MTSTPFLLVGIDENGETREEWFNSILWAEVVATACMEPPHPWQRWAIWGNDPETEEWKVLKAYGS